jgi:hypothetical protein
MSSGDCAESPLILVDHDDARPLTSSAKRKFAGRSAEKSTEEPPTKLHKRDDEQASSSSSSDSDASSDEEQATTAQPMVSRTTAHKAEIWRRYQFSSAITLGQAVSIDRTL